jgi:Xaa-Pro aminopeptidase
MSQWGIDAYLLFHSDYHQSEYLAKCDERIGYASGFTGSNGLCLITKNKDNEEEGNAFMWTDARYYLAAGRQLEEGWEMKKIEAGHKQYKEWITENMKSGDIVGFDPNQMTWSQFEAAEKEFQPHGITLKGTGQAIDMIWSDKPSMPMDKVWHLEDQYSGENAQSKFERLATELKDNDFLIVTTLDDIAWLLNLRGDDISFNPLFFSYLVFDVKNRSATLCIKHEKIADIAQYLQDINVSVEDYTDLQKVLGGLPANSSVAVDESAISIDYKNMTESLGHKVVKLGKNVIQHMKASKNSIQ